MDPNFEFPEWTGESVVMPDPDDSWSDADAECLKRIEALGAESLNEPEHDTAVLGYLAAQHMELAMNYGKAVMELIVERTVPLNEVPELPQVMANHSNLVRLYQRDLDLKERLAQAKRKAAIGPLSPGFRRGSGIRRQPRFQ